ncbi:MAG TPA: histidinol-phosphate aminotransferase family protein, partial [bacterium]|nr:histidinol-phosphate aminotransferase family protein [bacterium]
VNVCYNDDFSFPTERLLKQLSGRSKLIVIVNPANPLATVIDERDLRRILETARDAFVLLDETYYHFINRSYIDWLSEFDNLIIVQTFSKAFGLTGLRLGVSFSNVEIIKLLKKVNLPFAVNSLATLAAEAALDDTDFLYTVVANVKTETAFLKAGLEKLGIEVRTGFTNFLMMNFGNSSQQVYQQLFDRGILLRNLKKYPLLAGYLRASIGTRADNKKFLAALKEIVGNND